MLSAYRHSDTLTRVVDTATFSQKTKAVRTETGPGARRHDDTKRRPDGERPMSETGLTPPRCRRSEGERAFPASPGFPGNGQVIEAHGRTDRHGAPALSRSCEGGYALVYK